MLFINVKELTEASANASAKTAIKPASGTFLSGKSLSPAMRRHRERTLSKESPASIMVGKMGDASITKNTEKVVFFRQRNRHTKPPISKAATRGGIKAHRNDRRQPAAKPVTG